MMFHVNVWFLILIAAIFLGGILRFEVLPKLGVDSRLGVMTASVALSVWFLLSILVMFYVGPRHFLGVRIKILDVVGYFAGVFLVLTVVGKFLARAPWVLAAATAAVSTSVCVLIVCMERYITASK